MPRTKAILPHSVESEEAIIGSILLDSSAMDACYIARLEPADFYWESAKAVYEAMDNCVLEGVTPDVITVANMLNRTGMLDEVGGEPYLAKIVGGVLTPIGVESHIKTVINDSRLRKTIARATSLVQKAHEGGDSATLITSALESFGSLLTERDSGLEKLGLSELSQPEGMNWGIPVMDSITMGCVAGQMSIVAGATGEGKSMFAGQIARNIANDGGRVVIFSMEMANREYESRMAHAISGVRKRVSRSDAPYTEMELKLLAEAQNKILYWDVYSTSRSGVSAGLVTSSVRSMNAEKQVNLVIVDYLQLMERHGDNDAEALKSITQALKNLAMELNTHVLVVSQMNRSSRSEMRGRDSMKEKCLIDEEKNYPLPFVESLMGGAVENDADLVVMLQKHPECDGHMEVCVVKNRNGISSHALMLADYGAARLTSMSLNEISHYAKGDLYKHRELLKSQGLWRG
jgi:replicative DNA helicase